MKTCGIPSLGEKRRLTGVSVGTRVGEAITSIVGEGRGTRVSVGALAGMDVAVGCETRAGVPVPQAVRRRRRRMKGTMFFID
jgi:hypothetical protein